MNQGRRKFIAQMGMAAGVAAMPSSLWALPAPMDHASGPWLEISREAYLKNAHMISQMANGKPVLAVVKNNGYGLGDIAVTSILDESPAIEGFALVKDDRALAVKQAGVKKPLLLMGDFDPDRGEALARQGVVLSIFSINSLDKIQQLARTSGKKLSVALYIDTGLGRMGIPYDQAYDLAMRASSDPNLDIRYTFSTLTTPQDFAREQIGRFKQLKEKLAKAGVKVGKTHLAPSSSMLDLPESHEDMVRPGILIHGSFPLAQMSVAEKWPLMPTYRLKAKVMRLEKLKEGDTIGFSRFYPVKQDEWIATLPVGWADGYNGGAENGAKVLLGNALYPVVNVNASHTNVSLGGSTQVKVGDTATLIGPDRPEITPEGFGKLIDGHNYLQINYKESIPKSIHDRF